MCLICVWNGLLCFCLICVGQEVCTKVAVNGNVVVLLKPEHSALVGIENKCKMYVGAIILG